MTQVQQSQLLKLYLKFPGSKKSDVWFKAAKKAFAESRDMAGIEHIMRAAWYSGGVDMAEMISDIRKLHQAKRKKNPCFNTKR